MNLNLSQNYLILAKNMQKISLILVTCAVIFAPLSQVMAQAPLQINTVKLAKTDRNATINWVTNYDAGGKVEYGTASGDYHWSIQSGKTDNEQAVTLTGLQSNTRYYFRVIAWNNTHEVESFEQTFVTSKDSDNRAPVIEDVRVEYTTGQTATIQWRTDEPATSAVEYGLTSEYGKTRTDKSLKRVHDITLTNLKDGTFYHFLVKSTDAAGNTSRWYDLTFQTRLTNISDRDELIIYSIEPVSANSQNVSETGSVISWRNNKLTSGTVRYGKTVSLGKSIATSDPRKYTHAVTLSNLEANTTYYYQIESRSVTNQKVKSDIYSFRTKGGSVVYNPPTSGGQVAGVKLGESGFYGRYYNLTSDRNDVELYKGDPIPNNKIAEENPWYQQQYFSFDRVDNSLNFGSGFFPVDEDKPGDPYHFAVHWQAIMVVAETAEYSYSVTSDDDSWVIIDGKVTSNLGGIHAAKTDKQTIRLTKGNHKIDIYFAERSRGSSVFRFIPDERLKFYATDTDMPDDDYGSGGEDDNNGQVLGDKQTVNDSRYACNPNLGYTKFLAVYKTANSPEIWAILENGYKHYITSPEAFAKYQCSWNEVKLVSQEVLDRYPNARLVRTPNTAIIYYLFQRPQTQWLKIELHSPSIFVSYPGNHWGNVAWIDQLDIMAYPDVKLIKSASEDHVYLLENGKKRWIKTEAAFNRLGYDWIEVATLNDYHVQSFQFGSNIE